MVCYINIPVKYWLSKNFLKWNIFLKWKTHQYALKIKKMNVYPTERLMLSCLCGKSLSSHGVSSPGVWSRSESGSGHDLGETGVSSEVLKVPCPRAKPGKPGWKPGILTSSPPGNSGWNKATLALVPLENKTFQGYRAVKTGTKLMMRGTAQSSLHGRTCREAVYLFKTEARQKHTPREECGRPPEWEGEEDTYIIIYLYHYHTSLISGSSSWPLFSLANHPASFPTSDLVQGPLRQASASFSQDGFHGRGRWEIHSAYYGRAVPLFFDPRGTFPHMCSQGSLLDPKNDRSGHLISLLQQSSAPAMNFFLEGSRENKSPMYSVWQILAAQPWSQSTSHLSHGWEECSRQEEKR